ncbi:hypothetical protein [Pleionea sediminis]|uniref:hypothetical protein n=1 Tax=Pleionea sediminis TaxID=2569479 RepID=UPI001185C70E|nr:hypothetical protein [Pleionea sediminis]
MNEYELSKSLLEKKEVGVPMLTYLKNGIGTLVYRAIMIVSCVYLYYELDGGWKMTFILIIGALIGSTSQEIYLHYKGQKSWHLLRSLYDWNKIEEIVNQKTKEDVAK